MGVPPPSRYTRYPATPVPASVDAVQLNAIAVVDCAVAVRPCGMDGAVVSGGGGGGGGGGGVEPPPLPPPQPSSNSTSAWLASPVATRGEKLRMPNSSARARKAGPVVRSSA